VRGTVTVSSDEIILFAQSSTGLDTRISCHRDLSGIQHANGVLRATDGIVTAPYGLSLAKAFAIHHITGIIETSGTSGIDV